MVNFNSAFCDLAPRLGIPPLIASKYSFIPARVMSPSGNIICEATIPSLVTLFMSQFGA